MHDDDLSSVLSEFARTVLTDFPTQAILDHLVRRIVQVLPISAAGVTVIEDGRPRYVAASDDGAMRFEQLQAAIGQGPCLLAFTTDSPVLVSDLRDEQRFPLFTTAALAAGAAAVFTFPLRHGSDRLGALCLYRNTTGPLDMRATIAAQTLADVTAAYLINAAARETAGAALLHEQYSALHDSLTGLPNRTLLERRLRQAAEADGSNGSNTAVVFLDLDKFKQVNDTYGHLAGDELLVATGRKLLSIVRPGDTVCRVSGDEFVLLCRNLHHLSDVHSLVRRIEAVFTQPFVLSRAGVTVQVSASIGVAHTGPAGDLAVSLVAEADRAMYAAKRRGGSTHHVLDIRDATRPWSAASLEQDLRGALAREELEVAYQPVLRCTDGSITGAEALLRWTSVERGLVDASTMIAVAEQSGLILELGAWVLRHACRAHVELQRKHPDRHLDLAVNVSARQLVDPDFVPLVIRTLAATGLAPRDLVLEITETVLLEDSEDIAAGLGRLHSLGVRLALDDFGTGYGSLSHLVHLPIDIVKIDRAFTAHIGGATRGAAVVAAVTTVAHTLGLLVTVEGVETARQRDEVVKMGCDSAQGWFYSAALSAAALSKHLLQHPPPALLPPA